jgi:large subunit ribosomal protein L22
MEVKAKLRYYHTAPRKVRVVVDTIRGINVTRALDQLDNMNKKSAGEIMKLLKSAIANAVNNFSLEKDNLYIKSIFVDQGPVFKRWMPKAHGSAGRIKKSTSHVTIVLDERIQSNKIQKKAKSKIESKELELVYIKEIKKSSVKKLSIKNEEQIKKPQQKNKSTKSFIRKAGDK